MKEHNRQRYVFGLVAAALLLVLLIAHLTRVLAIDEVALGLLGGVALSVVFALSEQLGIAKITAGSWGVENAKLANTAAKAIPKDHRGHLPDVLREHTNLFPVIGVRVLWIDNHPERLTPHRRVLRRLGIDVVTATSTEEAKVQLKKDADFTLLIQDNLRDKAGDAEDLVKWVDLVCRSMYGVRIPIVVYSFDEYDRAVGVAEQDWITKDFSRLLSRVVEEVRGWHKQHLEPKQKSYL